MFVTRPIADAALRRLAESARVDLWDDENAPPHEELLTRVATTDAVISMVSDRFDAATIAALPRLAVISNFAVGLDNIDLDAATRAGIAVGHTAGVLTETTADLAFALMLAAARRVAEGDRYVRAGRWRTWTPRLMLGRDVWGATLGIIGWGAIGQAVARRAAGFGMCILYAAHTSSRQRQEPAATVLTAPAAEQVVLAAEQVELTRLLAESDFISINVPLTPATHHLIGTHEFAAMKREAIIVNTARGAVIDQEALIMALKLERIAGAGLDVTEVEPLPSDHPLLQFPNVVVTPHIGSASHATRLRMAELAVDNVLDVLAGKLPRRCANPTVALRTPAASAK
ncbi:MAG TPA: D-glycerate dehydrogenase [Candidatus Binataceae bacterium]|nr:D-glycerate dehydrogenase [Candidatus Binataceae bacterium]